MMKFNLQVSYSKRSATITQYYRIKTIYCNRSSVYVLTLSWGSLAEVCIGSVFSGTT